MSNSILVLVFPLSVGGGRRISASNWPVTWSGPSSSAPFVLTQVAVSGGNAVYTGTIPGGGSNALVGMTLAITGFVNDGNNAVIPVVGSTATTLTCPSSTQTNETHAGVAVPTTDSGGTCFIPNLSNGTYSVSVPQTYPSPQSVVIASADATVSFTSAGRFAGTIASVATKDATGLIAVGSVLVPYSLVLGNLSNITHGNPQVGDAVQFELETILQNDGSLEVITTAVNISKN